MTYDAYLDGTGGDMTVMRQSRGEGRAIVESVLFLALGHLKLSVEGINFSPVVQDFFFLSGEVWLVGHYKTEKSCETRKTKDSNELTWRNIYEYHSKLIV